MFWWVLPSLTQVSSRCLTDAQGKYLALESLLPQVGASFLVEVAGKDIIVSLITRISDGGHHAVALSDLLGELLSRLRVEMNGQAGLVAPKTSLSKKEQRKRDKKIAQGEIGMYSVLLLLQGVIPKAGAGLTISLLWPLHKSTTRRPAMNCRFFLSGWRSGSLI